MPWTMRKQELKNIFSNIRTERRGGAPHESWVRQSRGVLLMQVRNTIATDVKPTIGETVHRFFDIFLPVDSILVAARGLGVFLLVVGTMFGGGLVSAQVYRDAVPGGLSYTMKLAIERAQLALAPNDEYRTRLHTEFADRRMDEVSRLSEGNAAAQAHVASTLAAFNHEVAALGVGLDALKASDPAGVVETAKLLERKMAVYQNSLRKASALLPPGSLRSVSVSRDTVDTVTIKAMAVIVEYYLAGDAGASRAVVVTKFEDRIKAAEAKLEGTTVTPKSTQAKAAIAEAKVLIEEEKYEAALSKIVEVVELTKEEEEAPAPAVEGASNTETETGAEPAPVTPTQEEPAAVTPPPSEPSTVKE